MTLETERLILRPWEETDAEECYKYAKDPQVGPAAGWSAHKDIENTKEVIKNILMVPETYAIVLKKTGLPIGSIGLHSNSDLASKEDEAELGYWLGAPHWGQGFVPEASREMLRHAFEDLGLNRVWCGYYDGNEKSRRVQQKLGFKHQWTTENVPVPQMNETRRGVVNRITKEEWERLYKRIEGKRIVLRKAREGDYKSMMENVWNDEKVYKWMLFTPTRTEEEAKERYLMSIKFQSFHFAYYVALKENDEAIGQCGMRELSPGHFDECGIAIGRKYQGKGYGKEVVELLLELAFKDLGAVDFQYGYFQDNLRSKKVAEYFGFKYNHTEEMTRQWDNSVKLIDSCLLTREEYFSKIALN
ncbi:MAG: GNAT family N-acetyltransferase [Lachnospiraceae bacterium]|nr:GNAT family N-acetyltransferase [Lachnospiraceae bacterium]